MVAAITILDLSKVNVALPSIEDALGASSIQLQIIVSGYVLPFGWSWFLQGLPLDIIALILAWRILLTPSQTSYARLDLDPVGIAIFGAPLHFGRTGSACAVEALSS